VRHVVKAIYVVYAKWCPHCVPTTVEPLKALAKKLGVPIVLYDIDTGDEKQADELVKKYGDWTEDYLIPQVFVEADDGTMKHVLTGRPEGLRYTKAAVEELLKSEIFAKR
jgi:thiol-disulfide isomerase/thioredoxin